MSRLVAALLGKMPTTSVRRLISLFSRSSGLLDQIIPSPRRALQVAQMLHLSGWGKATLTVLLP